MPRQPPSGIFDQINYVIDHWANYCDAPVMVYVETALPAALDLFISLSSFGVLDVVREYARPDMSNKPRRSSRSGRKSARGKRGLNPAGRIAQQLPGYEQVNNRPVSDGVRHLWKLDFIAQRTLFQYMVADEVTDFAAQWTSNLYSTEYCRNSTGGAGVWTDGGIPPVGIIPEAPLFLLANTTTVPPFTHTQGIIHSPYREAHATAVAEINNGAEDLIAKGYISLSLSPEDSTHVTFEVAPGSSTTVTSSKRVPAGSGVQALINLTQGRSVDGKAHGFVR